MAQDLANQSVELKRKIELYKTENKNLNVLIKEKLSENTAIKHERDQLTRNCEDLTREKQHIKERLRLVKTQNNVLLQQRDEVEAVLTSLRQLIETQPIVLTELLERTDPHERAAYVAESGDQLEERSAALATVSQGSVLAPYRLNKAKHAKKASLSDAADMLVREKTMEITSLINRMTADCIAALDRINVNDDEDGPFSSEYRQSATVTEDEESVGSSSGSEKRRSDMTATSEAIANLDLDLPVVHEKYNSKRGKESYSALPFSRATIQEFRI